MVADPNTIGLLLLFAVVFLACILWATGSHMADKGPEEEDFLEPGKSS